MIGGLMIGRTQGATRGQLIINPFNHQPAVNRQ
jgi:hypothetical protein